ncbi:MAG: hypothetical protein KDI38_06305 [Calditrichaeota bacterium]|nr:hypothetical protein [Calditrichota bacterium]
MDELFLVKCAVIRSPGLINALLVVGLWLWIFVHARSLEITNNQEPTTNG